MKRSIQTIVCLIVLFLTSGCSSPGRLYTNITRPYTTNFNNTPIGTKTCRVKVKRIKEPVSRVGVSGEWNSDAIINAMREAGMTKCYYIDEKTFSLLNETYRTKTLILYGD